MEFFFRKYDFLNGVSSLKDSIKLSKHLKKRDQIENSNPICCSCSFELRRLPSVVLPPHCLLLPQQDGCSGGPGSSPSWAPPCLPSPWSATRPSVPYTGPGPHAQSSGAWAPWGCPLPWPATPSWELCLVGHPAPSTHTYTTTHLHHPHHHPHIHHHPHLHPCDYLINNLEKT